MSQIKTYRGTLRKASNGEEDDLLGLLSESDFAVSILAETIRDDMEEHGEFLSVRYFVADKPMADDELAKAWIRYLYGKGDVDYCVRYSEITGYLWTNQDIKVGGHDLLEELYGSLGKFLHLEITYSRQPVAGQ